MYSLCFFTCHIVSILEIFFYLSHYGTKAIFNENFHIIPPIEQIPTSFYSSMMESDRNNNERENFEGHSSLLKKKISKNFVFS